MNIISRKQLDVLIQLANSDHQFAEIEKKLIQKIAKELEVSRDELRDIMDNPEPIGSLGALSANKKFEYIYQAIKIMKADGKVLPSEMLFCQDLAIKLGYRKDVVQALIPMIHESHDNEETDIVEIRRVANSYL